MSDDAVENSSALCCWSVRPLLPITVLGVMAAEQGSLPRSDLEPHSDPCLFGQRFVTTARPSVLRFRLCVKKITPSHPRGLACTPHHQLCGAFFLGKRHGSG